ncbi:MAG: hypothetical protein DCC65_00815 [Planctomycetota bacterium]|nr:MAG: hypothetical protein DCC65_00815 [Planctomycetota bacterium]
MIRHGAIAPWVYLLSVLQVPAIAPGLEIRNSPSQKKYVCPPCPVDCHDAAFDKPGRCPRCNMTLVERSSLRHVAILLWDGVELLDFAGPAEVFAAARVAGQPVFNVFTVGVDQNPIVSQGFLRVTPNFTISDCPAPDVLVIPGGDSGVVTRNSELMDWIEKASNNTEMMLSVCTGAFVLAKAGLLDEIEATTWHGAVDALRREAPRTKVWDARRYVDSGDIITSAGVSAGIDGALHALARLTGPDVAAKTARYMEYEYWPDVSGKSEAARLRERIATNPDAVLSMIESQLRAGILRGGVVLSDPALFALHENPKFRELIRLFSHEAEATMITPDEPGERLVVRGSVRDTGGKAVHRALIYAFHTDLQGNYSSSGGDVGSMGDSLNPRLFAYLRTGEDGWYLLRTIRPGHYPGEGPPAHIHLEVTADGYRKLVTEMMFEGDNRLTWENRPIFEREGFVIAPLERSEDGEYRGTCDLVLRKE